MFTTTYNYYFVTARRQSTRSIYGYVLKTLDVPFIRFSSDGWEYVWSVIDKGSYDRFDYLESEFRRWLDNDE